MMLTVGIRGRINIIPVLQMIRVAPSGSIIGLSPVSIETDSQHLHHLRNGTRFYVITPQHKRCPHHSHSAPMLWSDYLSTISHTCTMYRISYIKRQYL